MVKQRHDHHNTLLPADCRRSSAGAALWSSQQAAAAWAWFEHGGSTCITPRKSEGLTAAKLHAKCNSAGPSRFKQEPQHPLKISADAPTTEVHPQRGHSFHNDDLPLRTSFMYWRFSNSCRSAPNPPCVNISLSADDQNEANDEEGGNSSCQDEQVSSLLDKFEVEAMCRQLRTLNSICRAELQVHQEAENAHHDHARAHHKPRCYFKSSEAAHKPLADNEHHRHINDVVHRILRLRIKISSRSTSAAPALCRSIATADSIVDHRCRRHHPASPNQLRAETSIDQMAKQQDTLHVRGNMQNTGRVSNYSGEFAAANEHQRGEFTSRRRKSQQKMRYRDLELIGGESPSRLHQSDVIYSKALQPLVNRLPHMSALLGHNMHGDHPSRDSGVTRSKPHSDQSQQHHYIHHHHHHYHHLQHIEYASQDALLLENHLIAKKDGAHVLRRPKLYSLHHKEELMVSTHGGRQCNTAALNPAASLYKLAAQAQKSRAAAAAQS